MNIRKIWIWLLGLLFAGAAQGQTTTIDFEAESFVDFADYGSTAYELGNYRLTLNSADGSNWTEEVGQGEGGSQALLASSFAGAGTVTVESIDGSPFRFHSFHFFRGFGTTSIASIEGFNDASSTGTHAGAPVGTDGTVTLDNGTFGVVDRVVITSGANGMFDIFDTFVLEAVAADNTPPSGYTVAIDPAFVNSVNASAVSFTFSGAEVGATYDYTFTSSAGTPVTGSGTIASADQQVTGIDLSGLADGTVTLSATLTDAASNTGEAATNAKPKETVRPTVVMTTTAPDVVQGPFFLTITYSENVTGFIKADLMLDNADLVDPTIVGGGVFTCTVAPRGSGLVTMAIAENAAFDAAGNGNTAAVTLTRNYVCPSRGLDASREWLNQVTIMEGPTTVFNNTSGNSSGYGDFTTSLPAINLVAGRTYNLRLFVGRNPIDAGRLQAYRAVLDLNANGTLFGEPGDVIYTRNLTALPMVQGLFTIPPFTAPGPRRMRIIMKQGQIPFESCEEFAQGEVEDYIVNITTPDPLASNARKAAAPEGDAGLSVFPNPARGQAQVQAQLAADAPALLQAFDAQGREVFRKELGSVQRVEEALPMADWQAGLYLIAIRQQGAQWSQRLVVE